MKRTDTLNQTGLTAFTDSPRKEVLFFPPRIFCFLIFRQRTNGTFAFAATQESTAKAKAKEPFQPTLYSEIHETEKTSRKNLHLINFFTFV
ncbi:MAG: hypothetical protein ACOJUL_13995 [Candidatus Pollutiaquabacter aromativorans]